MIAVGLFFVRLLYDCFGSRRRLEADILVAMILFRIVTLPQAYRGIDWNTCLLIGGMVPLATAMTQTGAADLIGDKLVGLVGDAGHRVLLAGLFFITACLTQLIANASAALISVTRAGVFRDPANPSGIGQSLSSRPWH